MRSARCSLYARRRELPQRWWACRAWNTSRRTLDWWACRRPTSISSANFFPAAKEREQNDSQHRVHSALGSAAGNPAGDGSIDLVKFSFEEVVGVLHDNQVVFTRQGCHQRFDLLDRSIFVVASVHKKLRFAAVFQEGNIRAIHWEAQADELGDSRVFAAGSQPRDATKTKARDQ